MKNPKPDWKDSIPKEVLLEIFQHLMLNDLCQVARICKRWNDVTKKDDRIKKRNQMNLKKKFNIQQNYDSLETQKIFPVRYPYNSFLIPICIIGILCATPAGIIGSINLVNIETFVQNFQKSLCLVIGYNIIPSTCENRNCAIPEWLVQYWTNSTIESNGILINSTILGLQSYTAQEQLYAYDINTYYTCFFNIYDPVDVLWTTPSNANEIAMTSISFIVIFMFGSILIFKLARKRMFFA